MVCKAALFTEIFHCWPNFRLTILRMFSLADDEADNFVTLQPDRPKFLPCVFKSFMDVQTVEIDRSLWETLVLLIKGRRRCHFVQTLHCTLARSSILFVPGFGTVVPPLTRLPCSIACFLLLAHHVSRFLSEILVCDILAPLGQQDV